MQLVSIVWEPYTLLLFIVFPLLDSLRACAVRACPNLDSSRNCDHLKKPVNIRVRIKISPVYKYTHVWSRVASDLGPPMIYQVFFKKWRIKRTKKVVNPPLEETCEGIKPGSSQAIQGSLIPPPWWTVQTDQWMAPYYSVVPLLPWNCRQSKLPEHHIIIYVTNLYTA